jgi:hypothetical protein
MNNNKYKFKKVLKKATKAGRRDGKNEVPKNDSTKGSTQYLTLLHRGYVGLQALNLLSFKSKVSQIEGAKNSAQQGVITATSNLDLAEKRFIDAESNVKKIEQEINGESQDMPSSLPAKRRNLGTIPYSIILFICTIAELIVTIPALQFLMGEKRQFATLLAFALGTATFFAAHFLGTTLKKRQDRSLPQPTTDIVLVTIMTSIVFFAITVLAYVRANQTLPFASNFVELPDQWKLEALWFIWTVWQITFFCIATVASFKHHSEAVGRLNRAKQIRFFRRRQLERARSQFARSKARSDGLEINWIPSLNKEIEELNQREKLLEAHYHQACALYVDSNIHARRQSIKGDHPAFEAPKFELTELSFLVQAPNEVSSNWDISALEIAGGVSK